MAAPEPLKSMKKIAPGKMKNSSKPSKIVVNKKSRNEPKSKVETPNDSASK